MSVPSKGFDPLASLFDPPPRFPAFDDLAREDDEDEVFETTPAELTEYAPFDEAALDFPEPTALAMSEPELTPTAPVVPPEAVGPSDEEKAEIARALAREAMARAKPAAVSDADKVALAKRLAAEALARRAEAGPSEAEKRELARQLALKAAGAAKAAAPPPPAAKVAPAERAALSSRARRPVSALEAARRAAEREERQARARVGAESRVLLERLAELLRRQLGGAGVLDVINAVVLDDRAPLRALWKGHRAHFAGDGKLDQVVAVTTVLRSLDAVAAGQLVAAIVKTTGTDYLVFVDLGSQATIAAFPDARAWYAGLGKA